MGVWTNNFCFFARVSITNTNFLGQKVCPYTLEQQSTIRALFANAFSKRHLRFFDAKHPYCNYDAIVACGGA